MTAKKVLIIAQDFSPKGVTASRRPGYMAKYLPEFGWEPVVLTRKWTEDNCNFDPTIVPNLSAELPRYEIDIRPGNRLSATSLRRLAYRALYPGKHPIGFIDEGKRQIRLILEEHDIQAIWTTAPPHSVLTLGSYAAQLSDRPWIADFRDVWQWVPSIFVRLTLPLRFHHERSELRKADSVVTVSAGFANTLRKRINREIEVIPHGFDEEIAIPPRTSSISKFRIVFTGGLRLGRPNLRPLLDAIGLLIDECKVDPKNITVEFYGLDNATHLQRMFSGHPYLNLVVDHGAVSRQQVLEEQRSAALLLVATHPGMPGWHGSKMIEYIVSGRPILAIPKDHDCIDELLDETSTGVSASTVAEIANRIHIWYREWEHTGTVALEPNQKAISSYSGREQAKKLAALLDKTAQRNR